MGTMEIDSLYTSCVSNVLQEKVYTHSDNYNAKICNNCGLLASLNTNPRFQTYICSKCGDSADIKNVESCWSSLILRNTLSAMGVKFSSMPALPTIEEEQ